MRTALLVVLASALVGCTITAGPPILPDTSSDASPGSGLKQAIVDPNVTLTQPPGTGVGVFVEYAAGGHWHIWWTCDTNLSGLTCTFDVQAQVATGTMSNVRGDRLEPDDTLTTPSSTEVALATNTSVGVDGVFFDTDPGATITVLQRVGNSQDGTFFFWSQGGSVMGGGSVAGGVADPLSFTPSSP